MSVDRVSLGVDIVIDTNLLEILHYSYSVVDLTCITMCFISSKIFRFFL